MFYRPERQEYFTERQVVVRTRNDPKALIAAVRQKLQSIDQTLPPFELRPRMTGWLRRTRRGASKLS